MRGRILQMMAEAMAHPSPALTRRGRRFRGGGMDLADAGRGKVTRL